MLNLIKHLLENIINDIDCGNSNISETEQKELIELIQKISRKDYSKLEAADYIGVSRATFDNYISKGLIPKGQKRQGFKELSWNKIDLDKFLENKVKM